MTGMKVAVVGASGLVGREILSVLEERGFPVERLLPFSSSGREDRHVPFRGENLPISALSDGCWRGVDLAFFATNEEVSRREVPRAVAAACVVVDNSSAFRLDEGVPLVVPEVNQGDLAGHRGIIANPNCCAVQLVMALAPIEREVGLTRVLVSTYQSVSGAGSAAQTTLAHEARSVIEGQEPSSRTDSPFPRTIAFNLLPQVGLFDEGGWCGEEKKIRAETRKMLHRDDLHVSATVVRVPVFRGHAESVMVETGRPISVRRVREVMSCFPGLAVCDQPERGIYPTPLDAAGCDKVLVGRIRRDPDIPHGLHFWVAGDNLRKGAALNAVQVAEALLNASLGGSLSPERTSW